jgi:hypothetical protein
MRLLKGKGEHMNMVEKTTWIPICCVCHQVRDDRQNGDRPTRNDVEKWMSLRSFLHLYRITRGAYELTHTYCLRCLEQLGFGRPKVGERLVQLRAEIPPVELRGHIVSDQMM